MEINHLDITLIKYLAISLSSFFIFLKALNYGRLSPVKSVASLFVAITLPFLMFALRDLSIFHIVVLSLLCGSFMSLITGTKIGLSITTIVVSVGISYLFSTAALIVTGIIFILFIPYEHEYDIRIYITVFVVQVALVQLLFKIKRFKKGFAFLHRKDAGWIGIFISGLIIILNSLIGILYKSDEYIITLTLCFVILCGAGFIYWLRNSTTRLYIDKVRKRDVETLLKTIDEQKETLETVMQSNADLAQRLHRNDEKIKAMEQEISKFKYKAFKSTDVELGEDMAAILDQLEVLKREYSVDAIKSKTLPATGIPSIDSMFNYMLDTAVKDGIIFDLIVTGNINQMVKDVIPTCKLETLIGDHVKDAIIAVNARGNNTKNILAHIGLASGFYEFSVKDNGIEFEINTLLELGKRPVTTHSETGGSGWGFMTTFETMRETKSSLIITEYDPKSSSYTKKVTIRFDGRNKYIIESYRSNDISNKCENSDIIIRSDKQ